VLTAGQEVSTEPIQINGRWIPVKKRTAHAVWFDFAVICGVPRSQNDYLVLTELFSCCFISDIPLIAEDDRNTICLFVSLVDVLYDARIKLVMSASEPVPELYARGFMIMEYAR